MNNGRILVYRLGSLGDTIIALPALHSIRNSFPKANITILTNKPVTSKAAPLESILAGTKLFDDIISYPTGTRDPFVIIKLLQELRSRRYDIAINLAAYRSELATFRDRIFLAVSGAKNFYGFSFNEKDKFFNSNLFEIEWEALRIARRVERIAKVDLYSEDSWDLCLSTEEKREAERHLRHLDANLKPIALSTGTKLQSNNWGLNNWKDLSIRLSEKFRNRPALFLGSKDEFIEAEACRNAWLGQSLNLCGVTSPRVSAAILKQCELFIGHDSGPMHLAACVGTMCVAVFSARNLPRQWFPRGENHKIIYHKTDCAGCGLEVCIKQKKKCIMGISVDEVFNAVSEVLNQKR